MGCIPAGSGNDFLRTFGTKAEFLDLAGQLRGGVVPIDLMDTSLGLSAAVCAAGLDAQVAMGAVDFRRNPLFHGEAAYLLSALRQICGPIGRRLRFVVDGESFAADVLMCAACNTRDYGGGFRAAPNAVPGMAGSIWSSCAGSAGPRSCRCWAGTKRAAISAGRSWMTAPRFFHLPQGPQHLH